MSSHWSAKLLITQGGDSIAFLWFISVSLGRSTSGRVNILKAARNPKAVSKADAMTLSIDEFLFTEERRVEVIARVTSAAICGLQPDMGVLCSLKVEVQD